MSLKPTISGLPERQMAPSGHFETLSYSDSDDIEGGPPRGVYFGGDGDVVMVNDQGEAVTFYGMVAGTTMSVRPTRIKETGTTVAAGRIVGLW